MGYTHYYYVSEIFDATVFKKVVDDFRKLLKPISDKGIVLANGMGEGTPIIEDNEIIFNGVGELSHETFSLEQKLETVMTRGDGTQYNLDPHEDGKYFQFTKTARKPYDIAVTACLVIAKHHFGEKIRLSSDGSNQEWNDGKKLCQEVLGYGQDFVLDEGGD